MDESDCWWLYSFLQQPVIDVLLSAVMYAVLHRWGIYMHSMKGVTCSKLRHRGIVPMIVGSQLLATPLRRSLLLLFCCWLMSHPVSSTSCVAFYHEPVLQATAQAMQGALSGC